MNRDAARAVILGAIRDAAAAWTTYPLVVEYPNLPDIDQANQNTPYLKVAIVYRDGEQMDLGENPLIRLTGQIILAVAARQGTGTSKTETLVDFISRRLERKFLGPPPSILTYVARPQPDYEKAEWRYSPTVINFEFLRT